MKKVIVLNKIEGETPLEALEKFRRKNPEYKNLSMTYAGRLDPMAFGVLIVLVSDEIKNKEKYLALEKEYEFKVLFGFKTDTYDILGKLTDKKYLSLTKKELEKLIKNNLKSFVGKFKQKYPLYSSKTVQGQPLFKYARLNEGVEVPEREVVVKNLKLLKITEIKKEKLWQNIEKRIKKVKGDFRQKEILKIWENELLSKKNQDKFFVVDFKIKCSSGTYVRGITNSLGEKINIPALAFYIKRIKIGKFDLVNAKRRILR
ncbi:MAG: hypothetical protein WAV10_02790 [Minisyncoccia bacterium]